MLAVKNMFSVVAVAQSIFPTEDVSPVRQAIRQKLNNCEKTVGRQQKVQSADAAQK